MVADQGNAPPAVAGGRVGVVLCHGFTGSPVSMQPWADALVAAGHEVRLPTLPGHGGSVAEANLSSWPDWFGAVERSYLDLERTCSSVFVFGLSMGGALSLRLAETHNPAGLVLVNPAVASSDRRLLLLPLIRRIRSSSRGIAGDIAKPGVSEGGLVRTPHHALASMLRLWSVVRSDLDKVTAPILLIRSEQDHVVGPESAKIILGNVSSTVVTTRVLTRSFHVATLDYEADEIFVASLAFIRRHAFRAPGRPTADPVGRST
jgi:carboxylesterase